MAKMVRVNINGKDYTAKEGEYLLDVCRRNGIYLPTLCTHSLLSPYGACRLCIVEVDGMRNFPTACTLPVTDGMVIRTDTEPLRMARRNILEFILSEHPSGCLLCPHREECYDVQECNVKLGITMGCRFCAKDGACELQNVIEKENLDELSVPSIYRNFPIEDEDPFFVRDYNLCILCGRCVRVCQDVRLTGTISFNLRGPFTKVGTAFEVSHIDAGCEFCGSCVDVCPTGALYERTRKFRKCPDEVIESFCPLCGYMCRIQVEKKDGYPFAAKYAGDLLCASGKFGLIGIIWSQRRVRKPLVKKNGVLQECSFDDAVLMAKELLKVSASEKAMVLSPQLPIETIMIALAFAERMGIKKITSRAIRWKGEFYSSILPGSKVDVGKYDPILVLSVLPAPIEIELKRSAKDGRTVYEFVPYDTFLSRHVNSFRILPEQRNVLLDVLHKGKASEHWQEMKKEVGENSLMKIMESLDNGNPLIIFKVNDLNPALVAKVVKKYRAEIMPITEFSGEGALLHIADKLLPFDEVIQDKNVKVIYSVGEHYIPSKAKVILQSPFLPVTQGNFEVIIPSLSVFESGGSYIDAFGRKKRVKKIAVPEHEVYDDAQIMGKIAGVKLKASKFKKVKAKGIKSLEGRVVKLDRIKVKKGSALSVEFPSELTGFSLFSLSGFRKIHRGDMVLCSTETASTFGLKEGDEVNIKFDGLTVKRKVKFDDGVKAGFFKFLPTPSEIPYYIKSVISGKLPVVERIKDV